MPHLPTPELLLFLSHALAWLAAGAALVGAADARREPEAPRGALQVGVQVAAAVAVAATALAGPFDVEPELLAGAAGVALAAVVVGRAGWGRWVAPAAWVAVGAMMLVALLQAVAMA